MCLSAGGMDPIHARAPLLSYVVNGSCPAEIPHGQIIQDHPNEVWSTSSIQDNPNELWFLLSALGLCRMNVK